MFGILLAWGRIVLVAGRGVGADRTRRKTPPSPATEPRHDCELSVSGGVHGGHTHEGRTKEDDGTQGAGPTSCVRRARERKNLAARSQNSRKDGDHNGDEPDDGHAGRRCPRPRLERRLQKALPRPEPRWQKALPRPIFLAKGATESRTRDLRITSATLCR